MKFDAEKSLSKVFNVHFFVVALAIAIGVYIFLSSKGNYVSSVDILLLPKSEKTAVQIDKVKENILLVFKKNRVKRKAVDRVDAKFYEGSTVINLKSESSSLEDAGDISAEAITEFTGIASKYYNIKNDLDLRIIDSATYKKNGNVFLSIFSGIAIGLAVSFIIQLAVEIIEKSSRNFLENKKNESILAKDIKGVFIKNKAKIEKLSFPAHFTERRSRLPEFDFSQKKNNEEFIIPDNFKKASSPQNLPVEKIEDSLVPTDIAPSNLPFEIIEEPKEELVKNTETDSIQKEKEPTEEEYRKRLNQLLAGE